MQTLNFALFGLYLLLNVFIGLVVARRIAIVVFVAWLRRMRERRRGGEGAAKYQADHGQQQQ